MLCLHARSHLSWPSIVLCLHAHSHLSMLPQAGVLKNGQSFQLEGVTWTAFRDKATKQTYYYNNRTGVSQWDDPRAAARSRGKTATAVSQPKVRPTAAACPLSPQKKAHRNSTQLIRRSSTAM